MSGRALAGIPARPAASSPDLFADRYRILRLLGKGGFATTHVAEDLWEHDLRALKVLAAPPGGGAATSGHATRALAREFQILRRLRHPGLARATDLGRDRGSGSLYAAFELIEGRELLASVPQDRPRFARAVLPGILEALSFLHDHGVVHGDLKPSNVLVSSVPGNRGSIRVRLIDFGLAASLVAQPRVAQDPRGGEGPWGGTAIFLAPERLRGAPPSVPADLFSLGVLAYLLIRGEIPLSPAAFYRRFPESTFLEACGEDPAAPLGGLRPWIERLTHRDPAARPARAWQAREDLGAGPPPSMPVRFLDPSTAAHRDILEELVSRLTGPRAAASAIVLCGEEGSGRRALAGEVATQASLLGVSFHDLSNRGWTREPFEEWRRRLGLADGSPEEAPARARLEVTTPETPGEETLLDEIRGRHPPGIPTVVHLGDLEALSPRSRSLLGEMLEGARATREAGAEPMARFLLRAPDPAIARRWIQAFSEAARGEIDVLPLPPLTPASIRTLVETALGAGGLPASSMLTLADRLHREGAGLPGRMREGLEDLAAAGVLRRARGRWHLDEAALEVHRFLETPESPLLRRVARLAPADREALHALALLGVPATRPELERLGMTPLGEDTIEAWIGAGLVERTSAPSGDDVGATAPREIRLRIVSRSLRESLAEACRAAHPDADAPGGLRSRAVAVLEARFPRGAEEEEALAELHLARGQVEPAAAAALAAAARHMTARRFESAVRQLEPEAFARLPAALAARRFLLLGEAYLATGRTAEAREAFDRRLRMASDPSSGECRKVLRLIGESHERDGDPRAAVPWFERALVAPRVGRRERLTAETRLGFCRFHLGDPAGALEVAARARSLARSPLERAPLWNLEGIARNRLGQPREAIRALRRALAGYERVGARGSAGLVRQNLGLVHARLGRPREAIAFHLEALEELRADRRARFAAHARMNLALARRHAGDARGAEEDLESALDQSRRAGDRLAIALCLANRGGLELDRGHPGLSLPPLETAERMLRDSGHVREHALVLVRLARAHDWLGLPRRGRELAERALLEADRSEAPGARAEARLAAGSRGRTGPLEPRGERWLEEAAALASQQRDPALQARIELARCVRARRRGRAGTAESHLRAAHTAAKACGSGVVLAEVLAEALRPYPGGRLSPSVDPSVVLDTLPAGFRSDLAAAAWFARHQRALRDRDWRRARESLSRSRELFAEAARGASIEAIPAILREALGPEGAALYNSMREASAKPNASPEAMTAAHPSLNVLLDINRRLGAETDFARLLDFLMDKAIELTRAQRGLLVLFHGDREEYSVSRQRGAEPLEDPHEKVSRNILREVARNHASVVTTNAVEDEKFQAFGSVAELGLKSVLGVPLRDQGEVVGAIYLDNPHEEGSFGEEEVILAEALADQAALAIRNLRRDREIARLHAELEERLRPAASRKGRRPERDAVAQGGEPAATGGRAPASAGEPTASPLAGSAAGRDAGAPELAAPPIGPGGMVGGSPSMRQLFAMIPRVAATELPVLIEGESGTGKELVARALVKLSRRAKGPFVRENCTAIPTTLLESELFGHVKGAFTGAHQDREGLFEQADGGTILLDEIGDMELEMQKKLLRILEEKEVRRIGSRKARKVDFRVLVATHRDLDGLVREGTFREDLYYRLRGARVSIPPLRHREGDLPLLVAHFLRALDREAGTAKRMAPAMLDRLAAHDWPGNVRELQHEIETLHALTPGDVIDDATLLSPSIRAMTEGTREGGTSPAGSPPRGDAIEREDRDGEHAPRPLSGGRSEGGSRKKTSPPAGPERRRVRSLEATQRDALLRALRECKGVKERAARVLGISRSTIYEMIRRHGLKPEDWGPVEGEGV